MKKRILPLVIMLATLLLPSFWNGSGLVAQNIAITDDDTYNADSSAMLDVKSINKGVLLPRLTTIQRNLVSNPATGLLIFDTDENAYYFYNGTAWVDVSSGAQVWNKTGSNVHLSDSSNNVGVGTSNPQNKLSVKGDASSGINEAIFSVVSPAGDTLFAVYPNGTRINVADDGVAKALGSKGGFAVGGFSSVKGATTNEYLRITPDSVRIYIEENSGAKALGSKGGFAVGGFSSVKAASINDYLSVNSDSVNVSKAMYIPRMTTVERDNLGFVPSEALIIFNTTDKCMQIYENSVWSNIWCFHCSPDMITQPFDATICSGEDTSFTLSATGTSLNYQWQISNDGGISWNNISDGGTNPTYSGTTSWTLLLTNVPIGLNGCKYRCKVFGSCPPELYSNEVSLNVGESILTVTDQPSDLLIGSGCNAQYSISLSSYGLCQWQQSTDGGSTWNNIINGGTIPVYTGTNTSMLTLTNVPYSYNNYKYRCIINNLCGTGTTSNEASLIINTFALEASNIAHLSFSANWIAISGATEYYLDVSDDSLFTTFISGYNNLSVGDVITFNVVVPNAGTPYYYRIRTDLPCDSGSNSNTVTATTLAFMLGDSYGGGIVFYIDGTGQHGLIAAPSDQSTWAQWGCYGTAIPGTYGLSIGSGNSNTVNIDAGCTTNSIAADIAINLVLNGYSDWFLPSKDELNQMYINRALIGGFADDDYWSSSQSSATGAWEQYFLNGVQSTGFLGQNKNGGFRVRAIRAF